MNNKTNNGIKIDENSDKSFQSEKMPKITELSPEEIKSLIKDDVKNHIEKIIDKFENKLANDKFNFIPVFGIFVSIVAFLSFQIQIYKNFYSTEKIIGVSLVILGSLLAFNLLLNYFSILWIDKKSKITTEFFLISIITFFIFSIGIFFSIRGNEVRFNENLIYKRYESNFEDQRIVFEKEYNQKIKDLEMEINKLKNK